jgi:hypothetical protein
MSSKMVSDRAASMRAVAGSLEQNANAVATRIAARLRTHLRGGERMPDVEMLTKLLGRELVSLTDTMQRADRAHANELADDAAPRVMRDRHAATLREIYSDMRAFISAGYGDEVLAQLRLSDAASYSPAVLAEQVQAAREALLDTNIKLPKSRRKGAKFDREAFAEEMSESLLALQKALEAAHREAKEADASLAMKTAAIEAYDAAFTRIVPTISALYGLAEQDVLASKLRVNPSRRGVLDGPSDPEAPTPENPTAS